MSRKKRELSYEIIRIIAIILVLYNHRAAYVIAGQFPDWSMASLVIKALSVICKCGPPLFLMISGAVLLGKDETYHKLYSKRVLRIVIVMVLNTLWYCRYDMNVKNFIITIFGGLNWYLYAYVSFLIMLPFLRAMIKAMRKETYILFMFFGFVCSLVQLFFDFYGVSNQINMSYLVFFTSDWASNCWHLVFPVMGYFLSHMDEIGISKKGKKFMYVVMTICSVCSVGIGVVYLIWSIKYQQGNHEMIRQYLIFAPSCAIFTGCKFVCKKYEECIPYIVEKMLILVGGATFGMFLLEVNTGISPWIYANCALKLTQGEFWASIISVAFEFIVFFLITLVGKQIPYINRLI